MDAQGVNYGESAGTTQSFTPKALVQRAFESNRKLQDLLTKHAEAIEKELEEANKLLAAAETPDMSDDLSEVEVQVPGAKKPVALIPYWQFLNTSSPFFEEASQRARYVRHTTAHSMNAKELSVLDRAVRGENMRIQAVKNKINNNHGREEAIDLENNVEGINWGVIAEKVSDASGFKRAAEECRIRWVGDRHPKINHGDWSSEETDHLSRLIISATETSDKVNWVNVAKQLGTNRTPLECMKHGVPRQRFSWSSEADQMLLTAIELFGSENWGLVAIYVSEHVTPMQCQARYQRTLNPALRKGAWTEEEDERLRKAVAAYGNAWIDIATMIPGRMNDQCRDRWSELNRDRLKTVWTEQEDQELLKCVETMGKQWKAISLKLGEGKTGPICRVRFERLKQMEGKPASPAFSTSISNVGSEVEAGPSQSKPRIRRPKKVPQDLSEARDITATSNLKPKPRPVFKGKGKEKAINIPSESAQTRPVDVTDKGLHITATLNTRREGETVATGTTELTLNAGENTLGATPVLTKPKPKPRPVRNRIEKEIDRTEQSSSIEKSSRPRQGRKRGITEIVDMEVVGNEDSTFIPKQHTVYKGKGTSKATGSTTGVGVIEDGLLSDEESASVPRRGAETEAIDTVTLPSKKRRTTELSGVETVEKVILLGEEPAQLQDSREESVGKLPQLNKSFTKGNPKPRGRPRMTIEARSAMGESNVPPGQAPPAVPMPSRRSTRIASNRGGASTYTR